MNAKCQMSELECEIRNLKCEIERALASDLVPRPAEFLVRFPRHLTAIHFIRIRAGIKYIRGWCWNTPTTRGIAACED
jgi:hypothetical protein